MNSEGHLEIPKTDEVCFEEIKELLAEGWKFKGNISKKIRPTA